MKTLISLPYLWVFLSDGLQLLNKQDEWLNITAPEGCIVVNVGDMLQSV